MKEKLLKHCLFVLCNKIKVLRRSTTGKKEIAKDELISVNVDYSNRATKI